MGRGGLVAIYSHRSYCTWIATTGQKESQTAESARALEAVEKETQQAKANLNAFADVHTLAPLPPCEGPTYISTLSDPLPFNTRQEQALILFPPIHAIIGQKESQAAESARALEAVEKEKQQAKADLDACETAFQQLMNRYSALKEVNANLHKVEERTHTLSLSSRSNLVCKTPHLVCTRIVLYS